VLSNIQAELKGFDFGSFDEPTHTIESFRRISTDPAIYKLGVVCLFDGVAVVYTGTDPENIGLRRSIRFLVPTSGDDIRYHEEKLKIVSQDSSPLPLPLDLKGEISILDEKVAREDFEYLDLGIRLAKKNGGLKTPDPRKMSFESGFKY
jgi:hypothetical protein